jgi:hypothetical protein
MAAVLVILLLLWSIEIYLLWIRSECQFVLFYLIANSILIVLLFDLWSLTWAEAPAYVLARGSKIAIEIAMGCGIVALFKWMKTRKTGRDKQLDKEMQTIRAEIAARDAQQ